MIKGKEQDNPKFSFLFGGEDHAYYRWKLGSLRPTDEAPATHVHHPEAVDWSECKTPDGMYTYWCNAKTGQSTWEKPPCLA
jgi:hypothetical protein